MLLRQVLSLHLLCDCTFPRHQVNVYFVSVRACYACGVRLVKYFLVMLIK